MKINHTPPYKITETGDSFMLKTDDRKGTHIAEIIMQPGLGFRTDEIPREIVFACNAHEALKESNRALVEALEELVSIYGDNGDVWGVDVCAVLAKAKAYTEECNVALSDPEPGFEHTGAREQS